MINNEIYNIEQSLKDKLCLLYEPGNEIELSHEEGLLYGPDTADLWDESLIEGGSIDG